MAKPSLALVRGDAASSTVTLGMALASVRCWERRFDDAYEALFGTDTAPDVTEARQLICVTHDRLVAARNRRDRVIAELQGERWLWAALEASDG